MNKRRSVFPGWLVVAAGFFCMAIGGGVSWFVFPVLLKPIEMDLGWSRAALSFAVFMSQIAWVVFAPVVGILIDRYGPRQLMMAGICATALATMLLGRMTALWHLYALFFLAALGGTASNYLPVATTVSYWFEKKRGMAMGIALAGISAGGFVMPILANIFMSRYGWRTTYFIFSFFFLPLLVPVYFWIHHKPSDLGLFPDGEAPKTDPKGVGADQDSPVEVQPSVSPGQAVRTRSFWGLSMGDFLIAICLTSIDLHFVAYATDSGISHTSSATVYGIMHGLSVVGMLAFGVAADRLSVRGLLTFSYLVPAVAIPFLFNLDSLWPLYIYAVFVGISGGGRAALWPLAISHCFGLAHFGALMGWMAIPYTAGVAVGPPAAGYIYDTAHSYHSWFTICTVLAAASSVVVYLMRNERGATRP